MTTTQYSKAIIATTHMVRNTIMTVESLEGAAKQITERERKVVVLYLLTRNGKVVGSKISYERQAVLLREMEAKAKEKLENGPNNANTADAKGRAAD